MKLSLSKGIKKYKTVPSIAITCEVSWKIRRSKWWGVCGHGPNGYQWHRQERSCLWRQNSGSWKRNQKTSTVMFPEMLPYLLKVQGERWRGRVWAKDGFRLIWHM